MPLKTKTETISTSAGSQVYSSTTGYLGNLLVRYDITADKDTTIQVEYSEDGSSSFTASQDKFSTDAGNTLSFWNYDGDYQRTGLLLEEAGTDSVTHTYTAYQPYKTVAEVRDQLKLQSSEYTGSEILSMIHDAMGRIHEATGRVWWGPETVTNYVIDSAEDDDIIILPYSDIRSITAFSIDDNNDGTFTDITTSSLRWNKYGVVQLSDDSEVEEFPGEIGRVKASFTHGEDKPTGEVRRLTTDIVKLLLTNDQDLERNVQGRINKLKSNNYIMV